MKVRQTDRTPPLEEFIDVLWWLREHSVVNDWEVLLLQGGVFGTTGMLLDMEDRAERGEK